MPEPVACPDREGVRAVTDLGEVHNCENCGWWVYRSYSERMWVHYATDDRPCNG